ncbi:MAG: DMT family transporter [Oligoflexia bacterium]|nr:DMT family transporter [Oligoflexia bacterium]
MLAPEFLMIISAACWGIPTALSKALLSEFPPLTVLSVQLLASTISLWLAVIVTGNLPSLSKKVLRQAPMGVLEPALAYSFGLYGLERCSATLASLIAAFEPLMVLLFSGIALGQRISRQHIALLLCACFGTFLVTPQEALSESNSLIGLLLTTLGTCSAALYVIGSKALTSGCHALLATATQQTCALVFALALALLVDGTTPLQHLLSSALLGHACGSGIIQYAGAFLTYLSAIKRMGIQNAVNYLCLSPAFGALGAYFILQERLTVLQCLGVLIVVLVLWKCRDHTSADRNHSPSSAQLDETNFLDTRICLRGQQHLHAPPINALNCKS